MPHQVEFERGSWVAYVDGERLVLEAHEKLARVPNGEQQTERLARILVSIYTRWQKPDEAEKWRWQ